MGPWDQDQTQSVLVFLSFSFHYQMLKTLSANTIMYQATHSLYGRSVITQPPLQPAQVELIKREHINDIVTLKIKQIAIQLYYSSKHITLIKILDIYQCQNFVCVYT